MSLSESHNLSAVAGMNGICQFSRYLSCVRNSGLIFAFGSFSSYSMVDPSLRVFKSAPIMGRSHFVGAMMFRMCCYFEISLSDVIPVHGTQFLHSREVSGCDKRPAFSPCAKVRRRDDLGATSPHSRLPPPTLHRLLAGRSLSISRPQAKRAVYTRKNECGLSISV